MITWTIMVVIVFLGVLGMVTWYLIMDFNDVAVDTTGEHLSPWKRWISKLGSLQWGRLRIPIVAVQIVSQCVAVTGVHLPPAYATFLAWASFDTFNLNMLPTLDCYVVSADFYDRLLFVTCVPLCGTLYLCLTYAVVVWKESRVKEVTSFALGSGDDLRPARLKDAKLKHFRAFLVLTFLVYSTVSSTIFQAYACDEVLDGSSDGINYTYLRVDYSVMCNTQKHTKYMIYAGFMMFIYPFGIPALYAFLLWHSRKYFINLSLVKKDLRVQPTVDIELAPVSDAQLAEEVKQEDPKIMLPKKPRASTIVGGDIVDSSRFLWGDYKHRYYYWEVLECLRRLLMTGFIVFLLPGTAAQLSLSCIFAQISIVIIAIYRPHADRFDFMLYMSGSLLVFLTMYLALNMKLDVGSETSQSQKAFSAFLISLHVGMVLAAFVNMWLVGKATLGARSESLSSAVNLNS